MSDYWVCRNCGDQVNKAEHPLECPKCRQNRPTNFSSRAFNQRLELIHTGPTSDLLSLGKGDVVELAHLPGEEFRVVRRDFNDVYLVRVDGTGLPLRIFPARGVVQLVRRADDTGD